MKFIFEPVFDGKEVRFISRNLKRRLKAEEMKIYSVSRHQYNAAYMFTHDILDHLEFDKIGDMCEELKAIGVSFYIRGFESPRQNLYKGRELDEMLENLSESESSEINILGSKLQSRDLELSMSDKSALLAEFEPFKNLRNCPIEGYFKQRSYLYLLEGKPLEDIVTLYHVKRIIKEGYLEAGKRYANLEQEAVGTLYNSLYYQIEQELKSLHYTQLLVINVDFESGKFNVNSQYN